MIFGRPTQFTQAGGAQSIATGEVTCFLILTPAAAAAACDIKAKGTGGTVVVSLAAPANGPSVQVGPLMIESPFISAFTGAGATLSVVR